jgi:hypothetical protein
MTPQSPNTELSDEVIKVLLQRKLLHHRRESEVRAALVSGKVRAEDWRVWAEDFAKEEVTDADKNETGKSDS